MPLQKYVPLLFAATLVVSASARAADPVTITQNAGWNWFSDARVLYDPDGGKGGAVPMGGAGGKGTLLIGSVAGTTKGVSHAGDVQVTTYFLGASSSITIGALDQAATNSVATAAAPSDDHLVPVFLKRPDGRYLAVWQRHDVDALMRWRISVNPGDATSWQPTQTVSGNGVDKNGICFSHIFQLSAENNRIYNFVRSVGYDPNYLISDDNGQTFRYGGHVMMWDNPDGKGLGRPYIKYISNNRDTVWFATTEDHPKDFNNGILAGSIKAGTLFKSDGTSLGALSTTTDAKVKPTDFTRVFAGTSDGVAFINDLQLTPAGTSGGGPHLIFSVRKDAAGADIRYWYARWDGKSWNAHEIAFAGSTIYADESSYAGLAALDPNDASRIVLSANSDPKTGKPLISTADGKRHYEIFEGRTQDGGVTWTFEPLTRNSAVDNIRPVLPAMGAGGRAVLWSRGTMTTYKNYDLDIVGLVSQR